jgi:hypothetical protein
LLLDDSDRSRYHRAMQVLSGWERWVFHGPKPYSRGLWQTSVWQRPFSLGEWVRDSVDQ